MVEISELEEIYLAMRVRWKIQRHGKVMYYLVCFTGSMLHHCYERGCLKIINPNVNLVGVHHFEYNG